MKLFVYGSLMRGGENHGELAAVGARFAGAAHTAPRYTLVVRGEYPALLDEGVTAVPGEIYDVDEPGLAVLDEFEGADYGRRPVEFADRSGVFAYFAR